MQDEHETARDLYEQARGLYKRARNSVGVTQCDLRLGSLR